jgi:RNA polymerase sigma-70 factor (ECF subfamily)
MRQIFLASRHTQAVQERGTEPFWKDPIMTEQVSFRELIQRVRAGDEQASEQLVHRYLEQIRIVVHTHLTDPRLRRVVESLDICQSVLLSFFKRARQGQYEIDTPVQLIKLLKTMARHKVISHAVKNEAGCRDYRRLERLLDGGKLIDPAKDPRQAVADREMFERILACLSSEEQQLADLYAQGYSWKEIARTVCGDAEEGNALRMQLARALKRVRDELQGEG